MNITKTQIFMLVFVPFAIGFLIGVGVGEMEIAPGVDPAPVVDNAPVKETGEWESKYNELWEAYKHSIWHYDAQAENLRKERDNLWGELREFRSTENITIEFSKP